MFLGLFQEWFRSLATQRARARVCVCTRVFVAGVCYACFSDAIFMLGFGYGVIGGG